MLGSRVRVGVMLGWGVKPGGRRVAVAVGEGVLVKVAVTVKVAGSVGMGPLPNNPDSTHFGPPPGPAVCKPSLKTPPRSCPLSSVNKVPLPSLMR